MKTVLIMGINGGFGGDMAQALARQGWKIRALMRDKTKLPRRFKGAAVVEGDASNIADVRKAAENVELVVYGVNPANYNWDNTALPWLDITATVAEEKRLNIIFPGNVYVFNPEHGPIFDEQSRISPISSKGEIRKAMEERLKVASDNGAKVLIIRCGDFIGKNAQSTWMQQIIKSDKNKMKILVPGAVNLKHSYAYLPDVARTVTEVISKFETLPAFNIFHFKGIQFNFNDLAISISNITGKKVNIKSFPWILIKFMSLFSKLFSGLVEMRYLWNVELNLDSKKLEDFLGHKLAITALDEILIESELIAKSNIKDLVDEAT